MPRNPVQPASFFKGIPDTNNTARDYVVQDGIPIDGSNAQLRSLSPFLIRVLLPSILGDNGSNLLAAPQPHNRNPPPGSVREDNRSLTNYSQPAQTVSADAAVEYRKLTQLGGSLPGLSTTSTAQLETQYNQAVFNQVFGPAVRGAIPNRDPNHRPAIVPAMTNDISALSLALQLKRMSEIPPLLLLINPTSMQVQYKKIGQFQERNRYGYIYQSWGEELPKLTFTFKIGAYVAGHASLTQQAVSGVQRASRNDSASFQQLQALLMLFKSGAYLQDMVQNSRAFPMIGNLAIEYDQKTYVGHMDTFSFGEEESQQHGGLEISVDFTAIKEFDFAPQVSVVSPMTRPDSLYRGVSGGSLNRSGRGGSQFFTAPTIGIESQQAPAQPWAGAAVTTAGVQPATVSSRRR